MSEPYPRDMIGYGRNPPDPKWPDGALVAVQFVVNYEEGGENNILHGDAGSEAFLSEIVGAVPWPGMRHMNMESMYEYGSRAGFWRLFRLFTERSIPVTVFGVAMALERNREAVAAMKEADWEIATHGLRWIDYRVPLGLGMPCLHLHISGRAQYHTGTFAYQLVKRGFKHGLRTVGTMKSEPAMNVLAIFER